MSLNKCTKTELINMLLKAEEQNAALTQRLEAAKVAYRDLRAQVPVKRMSHMEEVARYASKADMLSALGANVSKYVVKIVDGVHIDCLKKWA